MSKKLDMKKIEEYIENRLSEETKKIMKETYTELKPDKIDFGSIELGLRNKMLNMGSQILQECINMAGTGYKKSSLKCKCGKKKKFINNRKKKISTLVKDIEIYRAYYHCSKCGKSDVPLDKKLDIIKTKKSPGVRNAVCLVGAEKSFGLGSKILKQLSGIIISKEKVRTISENVGAAIEKQNKRELETYYWENRKSETSPPANQKHQQLYVSADGTCVNTLHGWKEMKLGVVFDARFDGENPLRGYTSYVGSFEDSKHFMRRLYTEAYIRGIDNADKQIAIADAARWIWNEVDYNFPKALQIVDYFHATERPWDIAKTIYPDEKQKSNAFAKPFINLIKSGKINTVISKLKYIKSQSAEVNKKVNDAITYFTNNKKYMDYAKFIENGYFIGSGVVEAGCKNNIGSRLKGSGMRWSISGGNSILQLRNCFLSDKWDEFRNNFYYNC